MNYQVKSIISEQRLISLDEDLEMPYDPMLFLILDWHIHFHGPHTQSDILSD